MSTPIETPTVLQAYAGDVLAGESDAVIRLRLQVSRIAPHFRTALVTGEPGVGKQTVARELHRLSGNATAAEPFVAMETREFVEGSMPALRGVFYLRGVERLDPALQERLVEKLKLVQRDVRVLVASECDLRGMLAAGRLRQSLAARIGSLEIKVAPLRERMDDLETIASAMLERRRSRAWFGPDALQALERHGWPGNLAELCELTAELARLDRRIDESDLPELRTLAKEDETGARLDRVMQRHVFEVLQRCSGNKLKAAEVLGISRSTLYRMLEAAAG